jgi:hypothetical protein
MKRLIGYLLGLGLIAFGVVAFIGQSSIAERSGNMDDFYAGLVMGGLAGFAGLVTLFAVARSKGKKADPNAAQATIWGVGMATLGDDGGDAGVGD